MTFTETDIKTVSDFVNFVYQHAKWELTTKDIFTYTKLYANISSVIKKMDSNVFELKKVIDKDGKVTEV